MEVKNFFPLKNKPRVFQVLLLDNSSHDVEIQEAEQVDFLRVEEHLAHGGAVFITSKNSQKIPLFRGRSVQRRKANTSASTLQLNHT
jgi:hypothetical protein